MALSLASRRKQKKTIDILLGALASFFQTSLLKKHFDLVRTVRAVHQGTDEHVLIGQEPWEQQLTIKQKN